MEGSWRRQRLWGRWRWEINVMSLLLLLLVVSFTLTEPPPSVVGGRVLEESCDVHGLECEGLAGVWSGGEEEVEGGGRMPRKLASTTGLSDLPGPSQRLGNEVLPRPLSHTGAPSANHHFGAIQAITLSPVSRSLLSAFKINISLLVSLCLTRALHKCVPLQVPCTLSFSCPWRVVVVARGKKGKNWSSGCASEEMSKGLMPPKRSTGRFSPTRRRHASITACISDLNGSFGKPFRIRFSS